MSSYAEALREFYNGEVYGEALFSALVGLARNADERLKWSMLLQLETETEAWLRAPMVANGVSIEERTEDRDKGLAKARERASLPWPQAMQSMYDGLSGHYVPLYQSFADAARARGEAGQEAVCLYMVEHERALVEFARRELAGASLVQSLEPVQKFLKYPTNSGRAMLAERIEASAAAMPDERPPELFTCWEFLEFCTVRFCAETNSSVASAKSAADLRT